MAGVRKEEFPPLLDVGFHRMNVESLRRLCVTRFSASITRPAIMGNLVTLIELINQKVIVGEIWIDGSFLTEKLNPDDVDLLLIVKADTFRAFTAEQRRFFDWYRKSRLFEQYKCDNYAQIVESGESASDWLSAYWLRQFGFSRANEMKGLAVIDVPFLVMP